MIFTPKELIILQIVVGASSVKQKAADFHHKVVVGKDIGSRFILEFQTKLALQLVDLQIISPSVFKLDLP